MSADAQQAEALGPLADGAAALALEEVLELLAEAWGKDPSGVLDEVEPEGRAASLGQVHRARLRDGRQVAVKVQYPDIHAAVQVDLDLLGGLSRPLGGLRRGFDLAAYRREIGRTLHEELDYVGEASRTREFGARFGTYARIPEVVEALSGERVLVTTWCAGDPLAEVERSWSADERRELAEALVRLFLVQVFEVGLVHADPHAGNYRFCRGGASPVTLLDFGCVQRLEREERLALLRLVRASTDPEGEDPFPLFIRLGFDPDLLSPLRSKLPALARTLFEPFAHPGAYDVTRWRLGERCDDILGEDRWGFRMSGPAGLVFLMRAFHGLRYYLERLGQPAGFAASLRPLLEREAPAMEQLVLESPADPATSFAGLARYLSIEVLDGGVQKARIRLPAGALERLEDLLEEELRARIEERGVDLVELVRAARRGGLGPRELFHLEDGGRLVRVALE